MLLLFVKKPNEELLISMYDLLDVNFYLGKIRSAAPAIQNPLW